MKEITDLTYNSSLIYKNHDLPFILYFYTNSCVYCKPVEKKISEIEIPIYKINLEENLKLKEAFNVRMIPTIILCNKNKKIKLKRSGELISKKELLEIVKKENFDD